MTVAHAAHWYGPLAGVLPILAIGGWIAYVTVRDRRRRKDGGRE